MDEKLLEEKVWTKREFLNLPHNAGVAAIHAVIELDDSVESDFNIMTGSLHMSDCYRSIELTLCADSEKNLENTLYKLKTIEDTCREARQKIVEFSEIHQKRREIMKQNGRNTGFRREVKFTIKPKKEGFLYRLKSKLTNRKKDENHGN